MKGINAKAPRKLKLLYIHVHLDTSMYTTLKVYSFDLSMYKKICHPKSENGVEKKEEIWAYIKARS